MTTGSKKSAISRRRFIQSSACAGTALAMNPVLLSRAAQSELIMGTIPSTGEQIPAIGLGSSANFSQVARSEDISALRDVLSTHFEMGGRVFDTAPSYGASEEVSGQIAQELGIADELFWATKLNVAGRGGGGADPERARQQVEASFQRVRRSVIDLIQVHNMGAPDVQLPILREYKEEGRIRYIGITTTFPNQYPSLINVMQNEELDFIGIDYAVDNRSVEDVILPLAMDRGIAVLCYMPFGRNRLWSRVSGQTLPDYAEEFDATTWAQFFLKFVISNPAITAATPSTSRPSNMADNIGGMTGRLPDEAMRRRMIATVDALPSA
jgi:aryl-alcohol dehydrogenase-like predicted oxidoreductase